LDISCSLSHYLQAAYGQQWGSNNSLQQAKAAATVTRASHHARGKESDFAATPSLDDSTPKSTGK
jgi:hypothetical protein